MKSLCKLRSLVFFATFIFSLQKVQSNDIDLPSFQTIRASGLGGAVSSVPIGIESLIYNPAVLKLKLPISEKKIEIIINTNSFFQPKYLKPILQGVLETDNISSKVLINAKDLITSSGAGLSSSFVIGYTNNPLAIGLVSTASVFLQGAPFPLGTEGFGQMQVSLPLGYSFLISNKDNFKLAVGLSFEPTIGIFKELDGKDVDAIAGGTETFNSIIFQAINHPYVSVPMDIGALFVVPNFIYSNAELRFSAVLDNLFGDFFVPGIDIRPLTNSVDLNTGIGVYLPCNIFGQKCYGLVSTEIKGINNYMAGNKTFWKALCLGSEFSFDNFLRIQLGLSSGYPCVAAQINLLAFGFSVVWQTIETGKYVGDNPLSIFKVGFSLNF